MAESVSRRTPLTRDRVLRAAIDLADAEGLDGLTMRRLAESLSVEAMSIYHHVRGKDAVLAGALDLVFTDIGTVGNQPFTINVDSSPRARFCFSTPGYPEHSRRAAS